MRGGSLIPLQLALSQMMSLARRGGRAGLRPTGRQGNNGLFEVLPALNRPWRKVQMLRRNSARADKSKRFRERLIAALWILALMAAMAGWLAGLTWVGFLVIERLF